MAGQMIDESFSDYEVLPSSEVPDSLSALAQLPTGEFEIFLKNDSCCTSDSGELSAEQAEGIIRELEKDNVRLKDCLRANQEKLTQFGKDYQAKVAEVQRKHLQIIQLQEEAERINLENIELKNQVVLNKKHIAEYHVCRQELQKYKSVAENNERTRNDVEMTLRKLQDNFTLKEAANQRLRVDMEKMKAKVTELEGFRKMVEVSKRDVSTWTDGKFEQGKYQAELQVKEEEIKFLKDEVKNCSQELLQVAYLRNEKESLKVAFLKENRRRDKLLEEMKKLKKTLEEKEKEIGELRKKRNDAIESAQKKEQYIITLQEQNAEMEEHLKRKQEEVDKERNSAKKQVSELTNTLQDRRLRWEQGLLAKESELKKKVQCHKMAVDDMQTKLWSKEEEIKKLTYELEQERSKTEVFEMDLRRLPLLQEQIKMIEESCSQEKNVKTKLEKEIASLLGEVRALYQENQELRQEATRRERDPFQKSSFTTHNVRTESNKEGDNGRSDKLVCPICQKEFPDIDTLTNHAAKCT